MKSNRIINFIKKDIVLVISSFIAIISCFFVKPSIDYLSYIDFRTLVILFCLMAVVEGLTKNNVFSMLGEKLIRICNSIRQLILVLILLCFFSSMFITNDVSLITFVPFSIMVLNIIKMEKYTAFVVVMQTIAANLGSMATPMGNPQNLYLYGLSNMNIISFNLIILPYVLFSLILIIITSLFVKNEKIVVLNIDFDSVKINKNQITIYFLLFLICILSVLRIVNYWILFSIIFVYIFFMDKSIFRKIDYFLLITFVAFFIFVGNVGNMEFIKQLIQNLLNGKECFISILLSQVISNVPTAILLSGFTKNYNELLIGVNIGGLGTIIASMASLISYKKFVYNYKDKTKIYLLEFTIFNVIFLILLVIFKIVIKKII